MIDIENSIKAQQSADYERWAKIENLKRAAKTMNFLTEHGITEYAGLETKIAELVAASDKAAAALKGAEKRLADMAVMIKHITTYKQTKPVADDYRRTKDKPRYRREHESTLILYEAAARALKENGITKLLNLPPSKRNMTGWPMKRTAVRTVRRSEKGNERIRYYQAECGRHLARNAGTGKDT